MDIAVHPHNNSLVIFIHGVMSNQYAAWKPVIDLLQNIRQGASTTIRSYDFRTFQYDSGLLSQPPLENYFKKLGNLVGHSRYDSIVLIGHSQGGILAKLFVIDELLAGRGEQLKVDMVITMDTPHKGPQPWIYPLVLAGTVLKIIPWVNRLSIWRQVAEMGLWSDNLKRLKKHWGGAMFAGKPCVPGKMHRHVRSLTVAGPTLPFFRLKGVVPRRSALGFGMDEPVGIGIKPAWGIGHGVATMLKGCQQQIEQELSALKAVECLALDRHFQSIHTRDVAVALDACEPGLATACEVDCWQKRLRTFALKPLRNLGATAAVEKFILLRLRNP